MKKNLFLTLTVLTIGATVAGGNAYCNFNDDMSELFLGGIEQIALADLYETPDEGRDWNDEEEECEFVVAYSSYNDTDNGYKVTCVFYENKGLWTAEECAQLQHSCE